MWRSWLHRTRANPPTVQELSKYDKDIKEVKRKAKEIDDSFEKLKLEEMAERERGASSNENASQSLIEQMMVRMNYGEQGPVPPQTKSANESPAPKGSDTKTSL